MYMLIAAALVISLIITVAPAQKVSAQNGDVAAEWTMVDTPTMEGFVIAPESVIIDYHTAAGGEVAYAAVEAYDDECDDDSWVDHDPRLLKSDDYCATWDDLTEALEDVIDVDDNDYIDAILRVGTDWVDPDFVAVALWWWDDSASMYYLHVFFSTDGGDTFEDAGEVEDGGVFLDIVADLVVTPESGGDREIFICGMDDMGDAALFHCTVTGDSPGAWHDATDIGDYEGWDDDGSFTSEIATDMIVSPSWGTDRTLLVVTVVDLFGYDTADVYLQCGSFGTSPGWNEFSTLGIDAVEIMDDVTLPDELYMFDARAIAGLLLPEDYNSKNSDDRVLWVWVNYYDTAPAPDEPMCAIMRVDDDSADPVGPMGQIEDGELFLTNISYHGTITEGEAIAGVLGDGGYPEGGPVEELFTDCCEGVQVYRNDGIRNMDICCERWHDACKPPTGRIAMAVTYVGDDKAYAVALGGFFGYDEGAWSVTFDGGDTWNQLSLIDTYIDYLSDAAVSPDCNKTFLVSVQEDYWEYDVMLPMVPPWVCYVIEDDLGGGFYDIRYPECDSVWLNAVNLPEAEEYSGQWLRTWNGILEEDWGMLRLPPFDEETTGDTVVLVDYDTSNVYVNYLETLACWDPIGSTELDYIMDLALLDLDTYFALDYYGDVAMFDDDEWQEAVDSEVDYGYTIAVWGDYVLVGGEDGDVSYSDDGGETFTLLDETTPIEGYVTVAFDSYFDENDAIYAAVDGDTYPTTGGIYLWILGESEDWTDIGACTENAYTGIVLDTADGNPMTSPETGGVLYASYVHESPGEGTYYESGVARTLMPIVEICCDVGDTEWDYLVESDPEERFYGWNDDFVDFEAWPDALKICGCLTSDSNTHLFALDNGWEYSMCDHEDGALWTFEDCYSKKGVEITGPDDGEVIDAFLCELCENAPFTMSWDRLCDACCYEIEFALDEDFTQIVPHELDYDGESDSECCPWCCEGYCPDTPTDPTAWIGAWFLADGTYYYRVRTVQAETDQCIRSWWSEPRSFTVAPTAEAGAIKLVSPEPGDIGVGTENLGFSWIMIADADNFDWVLDNNSDFSSPVESKTGLTATAYGCTKTLDYDNTYYWQVTAYRDGSELGKSAVGTFRTMEESEEVTPPPPAVTPFWVWLVIAIGAVLVIVVIVLIFRTRRV
jgi:hypothetical protein